MPLLRRSLHKGPASKLSRRGLTSTLSLTLTSTTTCTVLRPTFLLLSLFLLLFLLLLLLEPLSLPLSLRVAPHHSWHRAKRPVRHTSHSASFPPADQSTWGALDDDNDDDMATDGGPYAPYAPSYSWIGAPTTFNGTNEDTGGDSCMCFLFPPPPPTHLLHDSRRFSIWHKHSSTSLTSTFHSHRKSEPVVFSW